MAHHHPYPLDPAAYQITVEIGRGVSAVVYKALCLPLNSTVVAIKAIDLDQSRADLDSIRRESKTMSLLSHPNILTAHCSFTVEHSLWVVMPFMSAGSLQSIIVSSFPAGLPENSIAVVLKETLCALAYLHDQGHVHRDIKAGNILIDANGSVKLGDFGVSASIYEPRFGSNLKLTDIAGTPYWMAPEVIHSHDGYGAKADIWSFGITALEAAHGRPPLSNLPPSKSLLMKITKRFRFSDYEKYAGKLTNGKKFSKSFQDMVAQCLHQDPARRPTAEKLLKHAFFKNCRGAEFLVKNVLFGLPSVEARLITAKMLRIPSMGSRSSEEGEEVERVRAKQRRISGWNFNVDGFELDPIMNSEAKEEELQETKETQEKEESSGARKVKFGGELVIPERRLDSEFWASGSPAPSPVPTPEGQGIISTVAGGSGGGLSRESMVEGLVKLRESIDEQRRSVVGLIAYFGGGEAASREEELAAAVERLKMELVSERRKNRELLMELEFLKVLMSGGSQAD